MLAWFWTAPSERPEVVVSRYKWCRSPKLKVGKTVHPKRSFPGPKKCPSLLSGVSLGLWLLLVAAIPVAIRGY
jgi:hypothetical protein